MERAVWRSLPEAWIQYTSGAIFAMEGCICLLGCAGAGKGFIGIGFGNGSPYSLLIVRAASAP